MTKHCRTASRNMCTPQDKIAALFVDIDGTVMECQKYFDRAENEFSKLMSLCGFKAGEARQTLKQVYYGSMPHRGFERHRFAEAIAEAYHQLCKASGRRRDHVVSNICERIGSAPFFNQPELFPDVLPVLTRARHNFLIVAVTVGSRDPQKYKIRQGGLSSVFDDIIITLQENKAQLVDEFMKDTGVHPKYSLFVGNSVRSDGATLAKTNFAYLPLETSLSAPTDAFPETKCFELFEVEDWPAFEERAINRLIRRRRRDMQFEASSGIQNGAVDSPCGCNDGS